MCVICGYKNRTIASYLAGWLTKLDMIATLCCVDIAIHDMWFSCRVMYFPYILASRYSRS